MKKTLALALICSMAFSMIACFGGSDTETTPDTSKETSTTSGTHESNDRETETGNQSGTQADKDNSASDADPSRNIVDRFRELTKNSTGQSAKDLVDRLVNDASMGISHNASAVEEGMLDGFRGSEVRGFTEGIMFTPDFSRYNSIGYVFTLDSETDAKDFAKKLEENADRSFLGDNTERTVVTEVSGNQVLFLMTPVSYEK